MDMKQSLYRSLLRSLSASGLPRLMARRNAGQGGILGFHRLHRPTPYEFGSHSLSITPENFQRVVQTLLDKGYRFVTMSGLAEHLRNPAPTSDRFVCLTFDDGFVDNYTHAFPICRRLGVPMTVYLVSGFVLRQFPMWSFGLEQTIAANNTLRFTWQGKEVTLDTRSMKKKRQAYSAISSHLVLGSPDSIRQVCSELGRRYSVDFMALSDRNALTPQMIGEMGASGLVEFGAHGVHHAYLGRMTDDASRLEISQGKRDCENLLGAEIQHFAYPYGDSGSAGLREVELCRELGFQTAVTTESNTIFASDRDRLFNLPRLTFNGTFQNTPLLELLLSGTLPRLRRGFRRSSVQTTITNCQQAPQSGAATAGRGMLPV